MNENEIKIAIEQIKPDIYYQVRLKNNVKTEIEKKKTHNKKILLSLCSCLTAFLLIFGIIIFNLETTQQTPKHSNTVLYTEKSGFVIMASAEDSSGKTVFTELKTDKIYEHKILLKYINSSNYTLEQYNNSVNKLKEEIKNFHKNENYRKYSFVTTQYNDVIIAHCSVNFFKLKIANIDNMQEISVNNTSTYGNIIYENETPVFGLPLSNPLKISNDNFDNEKQMFRWVLSQDAEEYLKNNPNAPLSDFNDKITFTVKYKTGEIFRTSLDLKFNENGIATISLSE